MSVAAVAGVMLFLFGVDRRPDQPRIWAVVRNEFNLGSITAYENDLDRLRRMLDRYSPRDTVLATIELSGTGGAGAEGFLYPWQRHLQWYFPQYLVVFLVPEQGFAEVTRGHAPFVRPPAGVDGRIEVPAATRRLVLVLSGPTGGRLLLPRGPAVRIGKTFLMVEIPFSGELRIGSLVVVAAPAALRQPRARAAA